MQTIVTCPCQYSRVPGRNETTDMDCEDSLLRGSVSSASLASGGSGMAKVYEEEVDCDLVPPSAQIAINICLLSHLPTLDELPTSSIYHPSSIHCTTKDKQRWVAET